MSSYRGDPPSLHLDSEGFRDFVKVIQEHTSDPVVELEVSDSGFTHKYDDVDDLLDDPSLPDHILDFRIDVRCKEGRIRISYSSEGSYSSANLTIRGNDDWVKAKKSDLDKFFNRNKNLVRTIAERDYWLFLVIVLPIIGWVALMFTLGLNLLSFFIFFTLFLLLYSVVYGMNLIYPYSVISRKDTPYRQTMRKAIKMVVTLIAVVGSIVTIYRYFM